MAVPKNFIGGERLFAEDLNDHFSNLDGRVTTAADAATNASNLTFGTLPAERLPTIPLEKVQPIPAANIINDGFPIRIATGSSAGASTSAGATVTFPEGRFTSAPTVVTASNSGANFRHNTTGGITASGFTVYTYQQNGSFNAHTVQWLAVQS